jgi:hypothetical protein
MTSPSDAVDAYLSNRFRIGLEQLLLDATDGRMPVILQGMVDVEAEQIDQRRYPDGAATQGFIGTLTLDGAAYEFRCWVYIDLDGGRFLGDLSEFRPTAWQAVFKVAQGR